MNVLMSGGFAGAYDRLLPEFKAASGIAVQTGSGASQGSGPHTIAAQLARGVPADVVILSREGLDELIAANRITAGSDLDLARVGLGVAIKSGTPKPDVDTVEGFKRSVLAARTIAIPASTSGIWMTTVLFPRLGIADKLDVKMPPRGTDVTAMLAAGTTDIGILPVSEILPAAGVAFAGSLAPELQFMQTFSAAVVAGAANVDGAERLIRFLASTLATAAISASGMEAIAANT